MSKNQILIREEWRNLNIQINQQLKRVGKPLSEIPESEWKSWITDLMKHRDELTSLLP